MPAVTDRERNKYLARSNRTVERRPWEPAAPDRRFAAAVVIPALAESAQLPAVLAALTANPAPEPDNTLVLAVVNHYPEADEDKKRDNAVCLEALRSVRWSPLPPHLFWLDAASPGTEISRTGGVGEARKLGLDAVLPYLDWNADPLLFCLDGDTLVEPTYLATARSAFSAAPDAAGGVFRFVHQPGATPDEEAAIRAYERYLDAYVNGLRRAGSPYAYHAMGSAMVCRAAAYIRSGGMKVRSGGEDFYFLQGLRKLGPVLELTGATVHPSSRPSDRVPFGTGPRLRQLVAGTPLPDYPETVFARLAEVLTLVAQAETVAELQQLPERLETYLPSISRAYFRDQNFAAVWARILTNTPPQPEKIRTAFHTWFDAFRTLKFLHALMA